MILIGGSYVVVMGQVAMDGLRHRAVTFSKDIFHCVTGTQMW